MSETDKHAVLILAAGASTRMGQPKQLLPWGKTTLLNHAINEAKKISEHVFVVLGANKELIESSLNSQVEIIRNPNWEKGMGTSITYGISILDKNEEFDSVLIMLADQPLFDSTYLNNLKKLFLTSNCKIAATLYKNGRGVPAIFNRSIYNDLKKLNQDYGARRLMKDFESDLEGLEPDGKEIDIDTYETYQKLFVKSK